MAARLASTNITHGKSSELFSGDRDMHGHLEISGPNDPKGGVQYRNQGPIETGTNTSNKLTCFCTIPL